MTTVATAQANIKLGEKISYAASVTGLAAGATGTVVFALDAPDNATCSGTPVFTSTVALVVTPAGNGTRDRLGELGGVRTDRGRHLPLDRHLLG